MIKLTGSDLGAFADVIDALVPFTDEYRVTILKAALALFEPDQATIPANERENASNIPSQTEQEMLYIKGMRGVSNTPSSSASPSDSEKLRVAVEALEKVKGLSLTCVGGPWEMIYIYANSALERIKKS